MMRARYERFLLFTAMAALPAGLAFAQTAAPQRPAPPRAPIQQPAVQQPVVQQPAVQKQAPAAAASVAAQAAPAPAPLPPPLWTPTDALELLTTINGIGVEGLSPVDYDPAGLRAALATGGDVE
jgi:hypothetical protein